MRVRIFLCSVFLCAVLHADPPKPDAGARSSLLWAGCQDIAGDALKSEFMERLQRDGFSAAIKWLQARYEVQR